MGSDEQIGIIDGCLIQSQTSLRQPEIKKKFRLFEGTVSEWYDFEINGEKLTKQCAKVNLKFGKVFTLNGDNLKMITSSKITVPISPHAKIFIDSIDEMNFDPQALG